MLAILAGVARHKNQSATVALDPKRTNKANLGIVCSAQLAAIH
jgi:hypothetical protein